MKERILFFLLLILMYVTSCKKQEDVRNPIIKDLSSDKINYGGTLTIYGTDMNNITSDTIFITDSLRNYRLVPLSIGTDQIKVEIYNHESPYALLELNSFYTGIKKAGKIEYFKKKVTITPSWFKLSDFPGTARYKAGCFSTGGKIYVGCGASGASFKDFWQFDPATGVWSQKADLPGGPRIYPTSLAGFDSGYMGCGNSTDNSSKVQLYDFYKYNPALNTWTVLPSYPDPISNFYVGYFATVNGRQFAGLSNTDAVMRELVNATWVGRSGVPELMDNTGTAAFAIGNSFYVIAGFNLDGSSSREVWEYNTVSAVWTKKSDFPGLTRHVAISFAIGPYGYYGCGRGWDPNTQYKDMWRYDASKDKWIRMEDFPGGFRSHTVSTSDGTYGYAGLGIYMPSTTYFKDFWRYSPE